jgi:putative glycosyltransferase (TIGR04348 family)
LRISLITPAPAHARTGNRNTAVRWRRLLQETGHSVRVETVWNGWSADAMIALHARRSFDSIRRYAERFPDRPLVVVLTGTDLYRDISSDADARRSLMLAARLVVLQEAAPLALDAALRPKTRVIYQSAACGSRLPPLRSCFEVIVSGHLRPEKDPFRAAAALAHLPARSNLRVTHIGGALSEDMAAAARAWMAREPRYRWLGELTHGRALRALARSRALIVSSLMEGGANVVSEALALGVPVIASAIPGNVGMLGADYPAYYPAADEAALARLLARIANEPAYLADLEAACLRRAHLVSRERERASLCALLDEFQRPGCARSRDATGSARV